MRKNGLCRTVGYVRPNGELARFAKPLTTRKGKVAVRQLREKDMRAADRLANGTDAEKILERWFA